MEGIEKHIFSGGIEQDLAVDKIQNGFYFDALNMDIVTEEGRTTSNARNIKGTVQAISFPTVPAIYAVRADPVADDFHSDETSVFTVTINGTTVVFSSMSETFTNLANAINGDATFQALGVRAYTNENSLYSDIAVLYITLESGTLSSVNVTSPDATFQISSYAPNQTDLQIIGWTLIRDKFILFTGNTVTPNPVNTLGQIWSFTYDKILLTYNLELLYNNYINLSTAHPIANPVMITSRYETPSLQNVYWTDNNSPPRVVNVADPNLYSLDPRTLSLSTIVSPYIAIPTRINQSGGSLKTGIHYLSYRLSRETGGETAFFLHSYGVSIVEADEEESPVFRTYFNGTEHVLDDFGYWGGDVGDLSTEKPTTKSITFNIGAIDTNYSRIEFCHIYKKTPSSTPIINLVANEPVISSSMEFTLTGDEDGVVALTPEEYNNSNETFTKVGTLTAKNDYLFLGNVETTTVDIKWDARAYRHDATGVCQIQDDVGNTHEIGVDFATFEDVPETHACINPDDSPFGGDVSFIYQSDGTTIGGEGTNIKYRFVTEEILLDSNIQTSGALGYPVKDVEKSTVSYDINSSAPTNQNYPSPATFKSYHSPYISGFLKGYMRDEIYRFAIVFYDHANNPLFAKWIGDIRMPHVWMPTGANPYDRTLLYPITNDTADYAATLKLTGNSLGIEFTVSNLQGLGNFVSGYSIVRCIRRGSDKTVHGQGLYQPAYYDTFSANTYLVPNDDSFGTDVVSAEVGTLFSPNFYSEIPHHFLQQIS